MQNTVSASIAEDTKAEVFSALVTIRGKLDFLPTLQAPNQGPTRCQELMV
jgi:hypothetical protein